MSQHHDVLDTVESSSRPGKFYEIRKSHQDGKTYCTCPAWIFKARKGDGICKHIKAYKERHTETPILVMTHTDYENFRRTLPNLKAKKMRSSGVRRQYGGLGEESQPNQEDL